MAGCIRTSLDFLVATRVPGRAPVALRQLVHCQSQSENYNVYEIVSEYT